MKANNAKRLLHTVINLLIIAMIVALYLCMRRPPGSLDALAASAIYRGGNKEAVSLQFLIEWDAPSLDNILDVLKEKGIRATFIVSGEWSKNNGERLKRIAREGHEIATCGFSPEKDGDYNWLIEDITYSLDIIEGVTGSRVYLYYCGSRDVGSSSRAAASLELKNIRATLDLLCARGDGDDIIKRVSSAISGGSMYLLTPTKAALSALPRIIVQLEAAGFLIVTTGELLYIDSDSP